MPAMKTRMRPSDFYGGSERIVDPPPQKVPRDYNDDSSAGKGVENGNLPPRAPMAQPKIMSSDKKDKFNLIKQPNPEGSTFAGSQRKYSMEVAGSYRGVSPSIDVQDAQKIQRNYFGVKNIGGGSFDNTG